MGTITRGTKAGGGTNLNSGQTADPAEVNTDFNTAYTEINGNLDEANIKTARIPGAKSLRFTEIASPANPTTADLVLFAKASLIGSSRLYTRDSAGLEQILAGLTVEAVSAAEATTTATAADTTIKTITTSIPVGDGFLVLANIRKSTGGAFNSSIGLKVNTTLVKPATVVINNTGNETQSGMVMFLVWRQTANYLFGGMMFSVAANTSGTNATTQGPLVFLTAMPNATITSVILTGMVGNAAITLGVADAVVYRLQVT